MTHEKNQTNFKKFEERLYNLLGENNITTTRLSSSLKLDPSTISKCLKEKRIPSGKILILIADYFDVSIDYLVGRSDYITPEVEALSIHSELDLSENALAKLIANIKAFQETAAESVEDEYKKYTENFFSSSILYSLMYYGFVTCCKNDTLLIMDSALTLFKPLRPFLINVLDNKLSILAASSVEYYDNNPQNLLNDFCKKCDSFIPVADIDKLKSVSSPTATAAILRHSESALIKNLFNMYLGFFRNLTPEQITKFLKEHLYEIYEICINKSDPNSPDTLIIDFEKLESILK